MRIVPNPAPQSAAQEFGTPHRSLDQMTFALDNARSEAEIAMTGSFIWVREATDNATEITVKFNSQAGPGIVFQKGMVISGPEFSKIYLTHAAQANKSITLVYGIQPTISLENPAIALASVTVSAPVASANNFKSIADVTLIGLATTLILAANLNRIEAIITNLAANAQTMRIGDAGAAAAEGIELAPGQTLILTTTDEIRGFKPVAGNENVAVAYTEEI